MKSRTPATKATKKRVQAPPPMTTATAPTAASEDSMTTHKDGSPSHAETTAKMVPITPVPDNASEELGASIIKDYLTSPTESLPSTAWAKTTMEEDVRARKTRSGDLQYIRNVDSSIHSLQVQDNEINSGIKRDTHDLVTTFLNVGTATISRLRRIGSVMSSDEDTRNSDEASKGGERQRERGTKRLAEEARTEFIGRQC